MSLSIVSNQAAQVANQQLNKLSDSLQNQSEKLASGLRVVNAEDDVAASAISSRLEAEVAGLEQANRNAEQAGSLLQIADGAFSNTEDLLSRGQQLAVQAGSDNVSDSERAFLDQEFQAIKDEIDRLSQDTTFSGRQLVNGNISDNAFSDVAGVTTGNAMGVTFMGSSTTGNMLTLNFSDADGTTLQAPTDGGTFSANFTATFGNITTTGGGTASITGTGSVTLQETTAGNSFVVASDTTLTLDSAMGTGGTSGIGTGSISLMLTTGSTIAATTTGTSASVTNNTIDLTGSDTTSLTFAVGTGTRDAADRIDVSIGSIDTASLGLNGTDLTTKSNADAANNAITNAIDTLAQRRSDVAASQNRLDAAQTNIDSAIQNQSSANSSLIELNVANASTEFSQTQVRFQAASSTLTQAQQLPQNLLGLFQ